MKLSLTAAMRVACAALCLVFGHAGAQTRLPLESFGALPAVEDVELSPKGKRVAMLANIDGKAVIVTQELDVPNAPKRQVMESDNLKFRFNWFHWVNEERLLVSLSFASKRWGTETTDTRLLSVRFDGSEAFNLIRHKSFRGYMQAQFQDNVIDFKPDDSGKFILLEMSGGDHNPDAGVYKVNVEDGARTLVHPPRHEFYGYMVDRNHRVRLARRMDKGIVEIHGCDPDGENWRLLWTWKVLSSGGVQPLGFGRDPNQLYIVANHEGHRALFTVDLRDPEKKRVLKFASEKADIGGGLLRAPNGEPVGVFMGNGRSASFWDPDYKAFMASVDEVLPQRVNYLLALSKDGAKYVVYSHSDRIPGEYYVGDNRRDDLKVLAPIFPLLPPAAMAPKKSLTIKARDDLELPAYLTLPLDGPKKGLPAVVLVHGGPQGHDSPGFDNWAQFLANRGYAVLQVNFRGSTGFGEKHMAAGLRRWGREMQDDLADSTNWLIRAGIADPRRVCIVGASYGGYAALMGAVRNSGLYKCAFSFAGVADLVELGLDSDNYVNGKEIFAAQIGSLDTERQQLKDTSPRNFADKVSIPVLIMHGTSDRSVPYIQAEYMTEALQRAGKPFRFVRQEGGDHHLSVQAHHQEFFRELETFLDQHIGKAQ